jgi:hypothetical protein
VGKAIVYCGACGKSLSEGDFEKGKAWLVKGAPCCKDCAPEPAPAPRSHAPGSSARIPVPAHAVPRPASTRRVVMHGPVRSSAGLVAGVGVAVAVGVLVLWIALPSGKPQAPPPAPVQSKVEAKAPPPPPPEKSKVDANESARIEREMASQKDQADAAKFERFLEDARKKVREVADLDRAAEEIIRMLASLETMAGSRKAEVAALREEYRKRVAGASLDELLAQIREKSANTSRLPGVAEEVVELFEKAAKIAEGRAPELEALRTKTMAAIETAEKAWGVDIGFEAGFEKKLSFVADWGGLGYTEDPGQVREGKRAVFFKAGSDGGSFGFPGVFEGRTYEVTCWARRLAGSGHSCVGIEFWTEGEERLSKEVLAITSTDYLRLTKTVTAPKRARRGLFWIWVDKSKGDSAVVDDVAIRLRPRR